MKSFRITVVDTVELLDYQLARLRALGEVNVFEDIPQGDDLLWRLSNCDIAILGWSKIDRTILDACAQLRLISLWSTGFDYVDIAHARTKKIAVSNVPGYAAETISEFVIGSLIMLSRQVLAAHEHVTGGEYDWKPFRGREIRRKTLGIIGTGAIGSAVAKKATALGMEVIAFTQHPTSERERILGVKFVPLSDLLRLSDAITVHTALNSETRHLLGDAEFAQMKKGVLLVNTSRGEIVKQSAIEFALNSGIVTGACLDVLEIMPLSPHSAIATHPNVILTPHFAFNTNEAIKAKTDICVRNIECFVAGRPENIVN